MADEPNNITNTPNPAEAFQRMLEKKNGDGIALASQLFDENFQYRNTIRDLKAAQPKEGSVVLSADEAKAFKAYQDLGVEPKDIKKALDKLPELERSNKELASMESLRELADVGLDGSRLKLSVLKDQLLTKYPDAALRFDTQKDKEGKESKVAFIKTAPDAAEVSFTDFAAQNLSDYIPALKVSPAENHHQQPFAPGNTQDPKPQGGPTSVFDRIRNSVKAEQEAAKPQTSIAARFGKPANV